MRSDSVAFRKWAKERVIPIWKRLVDIGVASIALVLLSWVWAGVALIVRVNMGSPIFFAQTRTGLAGANFSILKFRTMRDATGSDGKILPDGERLTPFGRILRSTSLDELPELWNILRGDMSLVGPRPLLPEYLPYYTEEQAQRHNVRPGLTGLAQVMGRNAQSWDDRLAFDVQYVKSMTFWGDMKILALTVLRVFARSGINAEGHETMPRFDDQVRAGLATGRVPEGQE